MRIRAKIILQLVFAGLAVVAGHTRAEVDRKIAACFATRWSSARYNKSVELRNTEGSAAKEQVSESLSISCQVEIRNPERIIGICPAGTVTEMIDANGRDVSAAVLSPQQRDWHYEGLRYQNRFTQPRQVPGWQKALRSFLRIPANKNFKPELVADLQPSNMELRLDTGLLAGAPAEIRRIKGYFHAVTAAKFENVDVPFEPNEAWVRLTDDLEIQVREARNVGSSFHYRIEAREDSRRSMRGLTANDPLPSRIVTARQFIGIDGKPTRQFPGMRSLPVHVGGSGSGSGSDAQIKTIRFVIAVNPTHHEIPFKLEHIPLPDPAHSARQ